MTGRILCLLLVPAIFVNADNNVPTIANDFIFTFFNAYSDAYPTSVLLLVLVSNNNNGTANVVVTSPYRSFNTIRLSVAPYSVLKIPITPESIQDQFPGNTTADGRIVVEDKGISLQSNLPVAVYAHAELYYDSHYDGQSADSFIVIPAVHLGTQYVAVTSIQPQYIPFYNMIAVVAYQDNTQITIGTQTVTINALQVASIRTVGVLSGTVINGNKPFGAISGCTCGFLHNVFGPCNYEAVMLLPVGGWGTQFAAIPFWYLSNNSYQVVANTDNTVVSAGGTTVTTLNAGEYRVFQIEAALVTSNFPIQLIQIGQETPEQSNPFFLQLPGTDKMSNTNILFQPTGFTGPGLQFFLRIVTNLAGAGTIQLDGTTISALQFKRVPNSNIYYYDLKTINTTHSMTTNNPGTHYFVITYSYGFEIGCGFICAFDLPIGNPAAATTANPTTIHVTVSTTPPQGCPANWAYLQATNSCYKVFRQQVIWYVADEYCSNLYNGHHLTSVHSQAETDFIVNLALQTLTIADSQFTWIGANNIANKNQFQWSDQSSYDYQNWGVGEPVLQQGTDSCGVLTVSPKDPQDPGAGQWKSIACGASSITSFVCKIPSS
uniref:C-type lectin domain-containing protein n=1 Tax=Plectus sambesii TaxID=2011161 RepID=A0A914W4D2_9BILA